MIVSHRYKFIFIKTHKTAGSSIEMALAPECGPDDIVTPMESNADSGLPRNFHQPSALGRMYAKSSFFRKCIDRHSDLIAPWYYEHMPASRVKELIGADVWDSYHKFCVERNPWDKVVSYYNWKTMGQGKSLPDFKTWVMEKTHRLPLDGRLYFDGDKCMVDEVIEFGDFKAGFGKLCERLGIPYDGNMPREKTNITMAKVDYREYHDAETRAKVGEEFRREIAHMGYSFDEQ
jgi:hypothetical protein